MISFPVYLFSCSKSTRFEILPAERTGVSFVNKITTSDTLNVMNYEYVYNGAGTGVADLNNDGLCDIVFAANQVSPEVYLNQGDFKFKNITSFLGKIPEQWYSSVTLADVNGDDLIDIYLTATTSKDPEKRKNRLWINKGVNDENIPVFEEMAERLGVADTGFATNAGFFDYDLDGDLDLYILNNTVTTRMMANYRVKLTDGSAPNNDKLYRNNSDGTFTDVTIPSGIVYEGYGLGLSFSDINKDGYPDIYVSNDFMSNDLFYINQGDGTFKNEIKKLMSYQSKSSMGNDIADINNDGNPDVYTLDMMPERYDRKKQTINGFSYIFYVNDEKYGYEHQYLRNMLHLHNGFMNGLMLPFSEVGQMMGIYQTDWSWSPLFADYDNDADKDLIVTNGFPKDLTDKDWTRMKVKAANFYSSDETLIEMVPSLKLPNLAFENSGEYSFKKTRDWLPDTPTFSYGAAFADFDNDGDLDYVINNIDDKAFILKNNTVENGHHKANFIRFRLKGEGANTAAIGAKVELWSGGKYQFQENFLTRGYASSVEPVVHFGLAGNVIADSVKISWPSGKQVTILKDLKANQVITVDQESSAGTFNVDSRENTRFLFQRLENTLDYTHEQTDFVDYAFSQKIIPHKFSQIGPRMASGDINGDGVNDIIIGSTNKLPTTVFLGNGTGFTRAILDGLTGERDFSEADLTLIDIDKDGDNDVIAVAGGYENKDQNTYRHYLYENNNLHFTRKDLPVPAFPASVVRPFDYDHDGYPDLFIGSRIKNEMFPYATHSWIVHNDKGVFVADSASLFDLGMVTDAVLTDFDKDGWEDLLVAREWNSLAMIKNNKGRSFTAMVLPGMEKYSGLWYTVAAGDFDNDGDDDYIAGNIGDNTRFSVSGKYPMNLYVFDLELDGTIDPVISSYWPDSKGKMTEYPVNYLDELWAQSAFFQKVFSSYSSFSKTRMSDILNSGISNNLNARLTVNTTSSYILWNDNGKFRWEKLPPALQVSPIKKIVIKDVNNDGSPDAMIGCNDYTYDVPTGYYDAGKGFVLLNESKAGKQDFPYRILPPSESGMLLQGMVESLLILDGDTTLLVAGINRSKAIIYKLLK
jgi:hypothetical protein